MNKFQKLNFRTIGDFFDYLPENELLIVEEIRKLIYESIPEIKEKLSYNVPFYSKNKTLCFIWPSSVPWGNVKDDQVVLGFSNGHLIPDHFNKLEKGSRKYIRTISFGSLDDINPEIIQFYLFEALELDK